MRRKIAPLLAFLIIACSTDKLSNLPEKTNNAPVISAKTFSVSEHAAEGTLIGAVDVEDPDKDILSFSITSDFDIEINEKTGELSIGPNLNLDFETLQKLTVTVSVFDGNTITDKDFEIAIQDVDEMTLLTEEQLELVAYFKLIALWQGPNNTALEGNTKWERPMKIYLDGNITNDFKAMVNSVIARFNELTTSGDFSISLTENETDANAHVFFGEANEIETQWPEMYTLIKDKTYDGYAMTPSKDAILLSTRIWVSSNLEVLFKHELGHALGLGHSNRCEEEKSFMCSTIYETNDILPLEEKVIRYMYHSDMPAGQNAAEIDSALANILMNE